MRGIVTFNSLGRYGRLCNQAYQIAGTIGIARRNGMDFGFPEWKNYDHRDRFGSSEDIDIQKYFENPLPVYVGQLPERFVQWGYQDVVLSESVSLAGDMQSTKYFEHCLDEVRWYFRMKGEEPTNDLCGVHVRRGDYDNGYHPHVPESYYQEAMSYFGSKQFFIVFSDNIEEARRMIGDDPRVAYSVGRDYIEDWRLLKSCRHFIISNSSYPAFAAVLGEAEDKQVVAPSPWFGPQAGITGKDIYNSDWKVLDYPNGGPQ